MRRRTRAALLVCAPIAVAPIALALIALALIALTSVVLAACDAGGPAPAPSPSAMSDAEILAIGKQVAQCARDNGVPDFPDPYVEKGKLKFPKGAEEAMERKYSQQVLEQAQVSCKSIMDRVPEAAIRDEEEVDQEQDQPQDVETMRKLAQCLRDNGIPEWPDPRADGSFPLLGSPLEAEGKSPRLLAAGEKCKQYWNGSIRYS